MHVFLKNNNIKFEFIHEPVKELISPIDELLNLQINTYKTENYSKITKIIEPYGFLYSTIYPHNFSISKLRQGRLFYEFFEIFSHVPLDNIFFIGNFSKNECLIDYFLFKDIAFQCNTRCDLCFFEDIEKNEIIKTISEVQNKNGTTIIKLKSSKENVDLLYFLTTIYENVLLFRPKILVDNYLYIICQRYNNTYDTNFLRGFKLGIYKKIPLYFLNIANEYYTIIDQQFLFYKSQVVFYSLHENNEKIKEIKNKNIINSIKWCEMHGIPHNNIKINIFSDKVTMI